MASTILQQIVAHKHKEVAERKELYPTKLLEKSLYFEGKSVSMKHYITRPDKSGIIAEFKRRSPSKGVINKSASVEETSIGYMQAGASALSILTDTDFFGGKSEDLTIARKYNFCPILRKDFIIDEYQIIEAKSIGADAILLIAAANPADMNARLAQEAKRLGLEVLLEVHNAEELQNTLDANVAADLIGVNNRDLNTFEVSLQTSDDLSEMIPEQFIKVAESGIHKPEDIIELTKSGYEGFLIGERFMKTSDPKKHCDQFIQELNQLQAESL